MLNIVAIIISIVVFIATAAIAKRYLLPWGRYTRNFWLCMVAVVVLATSLAVASHALIHRIFDGRPEVLYEESIKWEELTVTRYTDINVHQDSYDGDVIGSIQKGSKVRCTGNTVETLTFEPGLPSRWYEVKITSVPGGSDLEGKIVWIAAAAF